MADRSVVVRLRAEVAAFKAGMEQAQAATTKTAKAAEDGAKRADTAMGRLGQSMVKNQKDWDRVGNAATVGGAAVAAGLGVATKAAIDWESAWTGVTKTVDGTPQQMAALEGQLRGLARTLPATHAEIAGVAEAAGQLGVKRQDIAGFTKTMIGLGESTNLSADAAATAIAQISNVMGTMAREGQAGVERFGSTLVALGNAGASTEADIVSMAQRLAGAGKLVGASEADVLALANAMSSMGIEAELGGGAMSRTITKMVSAVKGGGDQLDEFARIAGMTAKDFAKQFETDPIRAVDAFIQGLNRIDQAGGNVIEALGNVGIEGTQDLQVLLRLKGAGDLLSESLDLGAQAWADNTALANEAGKRYATTASQLKIARNNAKDAAIDFGSVLAPAVASASGVLRDLGGALADLPPGTQKAIVGVAGFGSAAALAVGGAIKLTTTAMDMHQSLGKIATTSPRAGRALKGFAGAAQGAAVAITALAIASALMDKGKGFEGPAKLAQDLGNSEDAVKRFSAAIDDAGRRSFSTDSQVRSFGDAIHYAFDADALRSAQDAVAGVFRAVGVDMPTQVQDANKALESLDKALVQVQTTAGTDASEKLFGQFAAEAERAGVSADELKSKLPGYTESLAATQGAAQAAGDGTKSAADGMATLGAETYTTGDKAQEAADKLQDLVDAIAALGSAFGDERASAAAYETAIDDAAEATKKYGKAHLDAQGNIKLGTEAGRALEASLRDIASSTTTWASNMLNAGASQEKVTARVDAGRKAFLKQADAMGIPADKAKVLADRYGLIPEDVKTAFEAMGADEAKGKAEDYKTALDRIPPQVGAYVTAPGATNAKGEVDAVTDSLFHVPAETGAYVKAPGAVAAKGEVDNVTAALFKVPKSTAPQVSTPGAVASRGQVDSLRYGMSLLRPKSVFAGVTGAVESAAQVANLRQQIALLNSRSVTVTTRYVTTGRLPNGGTNLAGGSTANADGNILQFANGGYLPPIGAQQPQIQPNRGPNGIMWAETGAGPWEAFISGNPAKADRSRSIADEVVNRLGGQVVWPKRFAAGGILTRFADGGFTGSVDIAAILDIVRDVTSWDDVSAARKSTATKRTAVTTASNQLKALIAQQRKAARDLEAAQRKLASARTKAQKAAARDDISDILDRQRVLLGKVAAAEGKVTAARKASADAARAQKRVEAEYLADRKPILERTITASRSVNKGTKTFLDNVDKLTRMGFKALALQLLDMDAEQAAPIAAQAVRSASRAKALQAEFQYSQRLSEREQALRDQLTPKAAQPSPVGSMAGLLVRQADGSPISVQINADAGLAREYASYAAKKATTALKDTIAVYGLNYVGVGG